MAHNYGLDYETGYDMYRDPQMRPAEEGDGICLWCGGVYPLSELERNDGMCLTCFYASLEPDPDETELFEEEWEGGDADAGKR